MSKTTSRSAAKAPKKTSTRTTKAKASSTELIEKASNEALKKLQALGIEQDLQNDLEWCIGSYRADQNPVGLYAMTERALSVFKEEQAKKTKGVTAKFITDLEKAIQNR
jgi:hypothetical protein